MKRNIQPCDALKPFIKLFTIDQTEKSGNYKVLPDTGIVVGFQYSGKMAYLDRGKLISLPGA